MTNWEKNLEVLRQYHPLLYQEVIFDGERSENRCEVIDSKCGPKTIKVNVCDYGRHRKLTLHSMFDPEREARSFAEQQLGQWQGDVVMFGFAFGYHVKAILELMQPQQLLEIFDVNIDVFKQAIECCDLTAILKDRRVSINISANISVLGHQLTSLLRASDNWHLILHVPSIQAISEDFEELKFILGELNLRKSVSSSYANKLQGNYLRNRELVKRNVGDFFNRFRGIPAIIVCAGPSLDKNKHLLRSLEGRALLICVAHALKAVLNEGIRPHFIITIDPEDIVYRQLEGLEHLDIPLILMASAAPINAERYQGPKLMASQTKEFLGGYPEKYLIETGGSVSTAALDIAIKMGCNPIAYIGQDLAYSNSRHHCQDTFLEKVTVDSTDTMRLVPGWFDQRVPTSLGMVSFNRWITRRIRRERDKVFVNATEGGALIEGFNHQSFGELISTSLREEYYISVKIESILQEFNER